MGGLTTTDDSRVLAHLDVKETSKEKLITDDGEQRSDKQHLPQGNPVTEVANIDIAGSVSCLEIASQPTKSENESNALGKSVENTMAAEMSVSPLQNFKLTWDLPCDILAHINRFHVYAWSETKRVWHFLGHTPVGSYTFSLGARASDFELAKFKLEAVLVTGDLISGMNMNVLNN